MSEAIETTLEVTEPQETIEESPVETVEEETVTTTEEPEEDKTVEGLKAAAIAERKKRQALEAELEELKGKQEPPKTSQPAPQESIEDMYLRDPRGTTEQINTEIARLVEEDPYTNAVQIERLRDLKVELRDTAKTRTTEQVNSFAQKISQEIPDFATKRDQLTKFAVEQLGYTPQDLATVTNYQTVGEKAALATIKLINQQYDLMNGKTPVKRESKAPEPITPVGTHKDTASTGEPDPSKDPDGWIVWERARLAKQGRRY